MDFEISKFLLIILAALCISFFVIDWHRGYMLLAVKKLFRHGATSEEGAKTLKELGDKIATGTKDIGTKIATSTKDIGSKIAVGAKDLGKKIKNESERIFKKDKSVDPNSTEAKLLRLLPYMSKKETHEVALKLLENDETVKCLDMSTVMPFLSTDDCDALFVRGIEVGKDAASLAAAAHFVSRDCLHTVVDDYIDGKYPTLDIDSLYPCLADSDIKKIFYHILKTENNDK